MSGLGERLFGLVEEAQGYAFISDAVADESDERVLEIAEMALEWTNKSARQLRGFIRRNRGSVSPATEG